MKKTLKEVNGKNKGSICYVKNLPMKKLLQFKEKYLLPVLFQRLCKPKRTHTNRIFIKFTESVCMGNFTTDDGYQ